MSDELNAGGRLRNNTNIKDYTHIHSLNRSNKANLIRMIVMAKLYSGNYGSLKLPGICHTGEEKLRKNLTQETSPDRRSNPGPLRDRCACYRLFVSGGPLMDLRNYFF